MKSSTMGVTLLIADGSTCPVDTAEGYTVYPDVGDRCEAVATHISTLEYARLFSAAPDLLAACREFVVAIEGYEKRTGNLQLHPCIDQARAAISRAEGR